MKDVGRRIRQERNARDLTLEPLAQKAGLSKSFLSQIERGLAQPSVSSLKKISNQFGISVVQLFGETSDAQDHSEYPFSGNYKRQNSPSYTDDVRVVRSDRRKRLALPGSSITYDLLTPDLNHRMEVLYVRAAPGEHTGEEPMVNTPGEKFGLVLSGSLEVSVGTEVFVLKEGDTIYHPANIPHSWRCVGKDPVEIVWVMTPPSF